MITDRYYDYEVCTSGIKEYRVSFTYASDAEFAYDRAIEWVGARQGIYDAFCGYDEIYIVCCNETLHNFLTYLEDEMENLERDEEMFKC